MAMMLGFAMPGAMELMIILVIVLLLFGGAKLPSLMRNLGKSVTEFKKGVHGMEEDMNSAVNEDPPPKPE